MEAILVDLLKSAIHDNYEIRNSTVFLVCWLQSSFGWMGWHNLCSHCLTLNFRVKERIPLTFLLLLVCKRYLLTQNHQITRMMLGIFFSCSGIKTHIRMNELKTRQGSAIFSLHVQWFLLICFNHKRSLQIYLNYIMMFKASFMWVVWRSTGSLYWVFTDQRAVLVVGGW